MSQVSCCAYHACCPRLVCACVQVESRGGGKREGGEAGDARKGHAALSCVDVDLCFAKAVGLCCVSTELLVVA